MTTKNTKETLAVLKDIQLTLHEVLVRIENLEEDSHPPVFKKEAYDNLSERLEVIEAFFDGITAIKSDLKGLD